MQLFISKHAYYSEHKLNKLQEQFLAKLKEFTVASLNVFIKEAYCFYSEDKPISNIDYVSKLLNNSTLCIRQDIYELSGDNHFFITPRLGTRSSWSSKATELMQLAGLTEVTRVERIKLFYWQLSNDSLGEINLSELKTSVVKAIKDFRLLYDILLEDILLDYDDLYKLYDENGSIESQNQKSLECYSLLESDGYDKLNEINKKLGLALSDQELDYLITYCKQTKHELTDVELMMFAQANSEHCRHKIFNASWVINEKDQDKSLFAMIKNTHQNNPNNTIKAYKDNGAIINSFSAQKIWPNSNHHYRLNSVKSHTVIKVETHNHPTAISPFPGAATGSGGEIRDEAATGIGGQPKAGLVGFTVSNLNIDDNKWEVHLPPPHGMQSALDIMLEAPIGAARFNNEFGRPNICGYFRDFCWQYDTNKYYGYHKPIMLAGGVGSINNDNTEKKVFGKDCLVVVLGGPALLIGLGGSAASSSTADLKNSKLDYASVQRENPEMQRRCQEVINNCWQDTNNPILSIHDVGAGGLSNAIPEIINDSACGAELEFDKIPTDDNTMSPMELWCNEAQERYVLVITSDSLNKFDQYCRRERCPYAVLGVTTQSEVSNKIIAKCNSNAIRPINLPLDVLFGNTPRTIKEINLDEVEQYYYELRARSRTTDNRFLPDINQNFIDFKFKLTEDCYKVLSHPTVASKQYLITIGDRSVGGLVARDQMVGPYQVPVSDCAVTLTDFVQLHGEAMAIGERTPLALINARAAARLAVGEAVTNILSADITKLSDIKLSANWMVASGEAVEDHALYESVKTIGMEFCPDLDIAIPVGKDSMSMRTKWHHDNTDYDVKSPLSLVISAFAPVNNVNKTLTPVLRDFPNSSLWVIDLSHSECMNKKDDYSNLDLLNGSIWSQVNQSFLLSNLSSSGKSDVGGDSSTVLSYFETIDIDSKIFKKFVNCILELKQKSLIHAYHDRSDGGLWTSLCEIAFANQTGIDIILESQGNQLSLNSVSLYNYMFNEALGCVVQIDNSDSVLVSSILSKYGILKYTCKIAETNMYKKINISQNGKELFSENLRDLFKTWSKTSSKIQSLRDNHEVVQNELIRIEDGNVYKLNLLYDYKIKPDEIEKLIDNNLSIKPKAAILREQGTNGHIEMAAALTRAGFDCIDIHMNDILFNKRNLKDCDFLAVCGGFSYGDVLGAGRGWAARILHNNFARTVFAEFFNRPDTLTLGVCNGCQMLAQLKEIIPGAENFPEFLGNLSEQFEARLTAVKIIKSNSVLLSGMEESILPVVISHGEGRVHYEKNINNITDNIVSMQFVDNDQQIAKKYPANPNGSINAITGLCSTDGRVTIMMPHPERVFRSAQLSWCPPEWLETDDSPWMRMFYNARVWFN